MSGDPRVRLTLLSVVWLALLFRGGGAQQPAFPWSEEVRLTDHPDSSFSDWTATTNIGHARTRDCLHVIRRDFMLHTAECEPASEKCWHVVHQIGWASGDWGLSGVTGPTTRGVCLISGPNPSLGDNSGNLVVDGAGRAHVIWESRATAVLRALHKWRDPLTDKIAPCRSFQLTASEDRDSTCTQHGWPDDREFVVSPYGLDAANPVLLITRPDFSVGPEDTTETLHAFYHRGVRGAVPSRVGHRWRTLGRPTSWTMGPTWTPSAAPDSESVIFESAVDGAGSVSAVSDPTSGRLLVAYHVELGGAGGAVHRVASAAGPGLPWTSVEMPSPAGGWGLEGIPILTGGSDGRIYLLREECSPCRPDTAWVGRLALFVKEGTSAWGSAINVSSESLSWQSGDAHATRGHFTVREASDGAELHVVWQKDKYGSRKIMHRYLRVGGDPEEVADWSVITEVVNTGFGVTGAKIHSEDGRLFVTWQDFRWVGTESPWNTEICHVWGPEPTTGIMPIEMATAATTVFRGFHPNPFRAVTRGQVALAQADMEKRVTVGIFDVRGRSVRAMRRSGPSPGGYEVHWDGRDGSGRRVAPGVYFVRVQVDSRLVHQSKVVYLR